MEHNSFLRIFGKIAGADTRILNIANSPKEQAYFTMLGITILSLSLLAWYTTDHTLMLLLSEKDGYVRITTLAIGMCTGFVYMNLYRFVFVVTPGEGEGAHDLTDKFSYNAGLAARFIAIGLLGFIVAKCYELYLYERSIEPILNLLNDESKSELRHRTRLYLGFSVSEMDYIKTGGILARIKLVHALLGTRVWISTVLLTFMYTIPLILKTFSTTIQDGKYQKLKVLEQNLIVSNARILSKTHIRKDFKQNLNKDIEPYNI